MINTKIKGKYILIIGSIGLILTHTVITLYTAIFCLIYVIINRKKIDKELIKNIAICFIFIIVITSFFWAPLLEHKLATEYEVFKEGRMERTEVLIAYKLDVKELFYTPSDNNIIYEIGIISIIFILLTPFVIRKLKKEESNKQMYQFYLFSLITGLICLVMTLKVFPFEYLPSILKMIQFSFRLLEFSSFFLAFVVAINMGYIIKNIRYRDVCILIIILCLYTCKFKNFIHTTNNYDEARLWPAVTVTENTGRVHAGLATFEYLPSKAFENRKYIETRSDEVIILKGSAQIENSYKEKTNLNFNINYVLESTDLELPYIYYLGYEAILYVNDNEVKLDIKESENGFLQITVPILEEGKVEVRYTGTKIMEITYVSSILGSMLLIVYWLYTKSEYLID